MTNLDNLFAALVCIGGIVSCVRLFIRRPDDRFMALLVAIVLAVNCVAQGAVVLNLNRAMGNGTYEVASEMLIVIAVMLIVTRRGK